MTVAPPSSSNGAPTGGADDPLHSLYRMSRTAGLGSGDYVAINSTAIISLLLGLASVLSLLYPLMLVVAAAALVCGIMAFMQIRSSNGTQSGRTFAALGVLLALGLGGVAGGKIVFERVERRRDIQRMDELVTRLNDMIVAKEYTKAYQSLFSEGFRKDFSEQDFINRWDGMTTYLGVVQKVDWGKRAEFEQVRANNSRRAVAASSIKFEKSEVPGVQPMTFALASDGEWVIDGIGQMFEKPKEGPGRVPMPDPNEPLGPTFSPTFPMPGGPTGPQ